ncbi:DUF4386 domain-containing protein [Gordonia sp. NPDC003376]
MSSRRRLAVAAAILYLVTWVTSVAAVPLYGGSAADSSAALGDRHAVLLAALLEVVLAVAVVGTAVALFPLLHPHGSGSAIGYVALRTLEASVILVGVVSILPAVARPATSAGPGLDPSSIDALHLTHDWTFVVGPGLINPVTAVVLAALLLRHRLVPRVIPLLGIVGGVLVATMNVGVTAGVISPQPVAALPLFAWEILLAGHLLVRGIPEPEAATGNLPEPHPIKAGL